MTAWLSSWRMVTIIIQGNKDSLFITRKENMPGFSIVWRNYSFKPSQTDSFWISFEPSSPLVQGGYQEHTLLFTSIAIFLLALEAVLVVWLGVLKFAALSGGRILLLCQKVDLNSVAFASCSLLQALIQQILICMICLIPSLLRDDEDNELCPLYIPSTWLPSARHCHTCSEH
jgi:hypothetical protein